MDKPLEQAPERLSSLDAVRGFLMFWIIGFDDILQRIAVIVNNKVFSDITVYFTKHVRWEGFRFYDLIFPMFLFLIGIGITYSIGGRLEKGVKKRFLLLRIIKRTLILLGLSLVFYGAFSGTINYLPVLGVLQRLALGYFFASVIFLYTNKQVQVSLAILILLGYWALLKLVPVPGYPLGDLTFNGNLVGYIDRTLLRPEQLLWKTFDPEGLLSTLPAVATALLGVFTGYWLRSVQKPLIKAAGLFGSGAVLLAIGNIWGIFFPVIKSLWTSSYVLVAGGWSLLYLGLFYLIIDVWKIKKWAYIFIIIGVNPITIYVGQKVFDFWGPTGYLVNGILKHIPCQRGLIFVCCVLALKLIILGYLHHRKIYLRA